MKTTCLKCGSAYELEETLAGSEAECAQCGAVFTVKAADETVPAGPAVGAGDGLAELDPPGGSWTRSIQPNRPAQRLFALSSSSE